jgi:hypothetical protein
VPASTLTLIGKPGCHLCDDARQVVVGVLDDLGREGLTVRLVERSILDEPALAAVYAEAVPVVLVDDHVHGRWHIDPARLRAELLAG